MKKGICKQCGKEFEKTKGSKLGNFCSNSCKCKRYQKYKHYDCVVCGKSFKVMYHSKVTGVGTNSKNTCGSEECKIINRRNNDNNYNDRKRDRIHFLQKNGEERTTEDTLFSDNKEKYSDKLIDYKGSPTGKGYIGLAKRPLITNDNGIGYKGVLMQSENRNLVQCYECGKWYKTIVSRHLKSHGITKEEYKEKYGLNKTQSLVSDTYSRFYATNIINCVNKYKLIPQEQKDEWLKKGRETNMRKKGKKYNTDQMKNDNGTCDLQLKTRLIDYILGHHKYPPQNKYPYTTLINRFGSTNNALKVYGLPTRQRIGYATLYEFKDGYSFKMLKGKGYEELYDIMKLKCPILSDINL